MELSSVGLKKDLSNVDTAGKETIVGFGMPDWNAQITFSTPFTAPSNGICYIYLQNVAESGCTLTIYVNEKNILTPRIAADNPAGAMPFGFHVKKGDVVTFTSTYGTTSVFTPCIGG